MSDGQNESCSGPEVGLEETWWGRVQSQPRFPRSPFLDSFRLADYPDRTCAVSAIGIVFSKPKHAGCRIPAHDDDSFYAEVQRPLAL